jgi:phenylacetate-CoA ligase
MLRFYSTSIYKHLPLFLQNTFVTFKGSLYYLARHGFDFHSRQADIQHFEQLSQGEIADYQFKKLRELLEHAAAHVPYYRQLFAKIGFTPADLGTLADLAKIPLLDKETIRANHSDLVATNRLRPFLLEGHTSGTTGSYLPIFMDNHLIREEFVFSDRLYRWAGGSVHSRRAIFRGDLVAPMEQRRPPFWRYDAFSKQMFFSSYHISAPNMAAYLAQLEAFDPEIIAAYPSALWAMSQILENQGRQLCLPSLKGIVTSSETVFPRERAIIEKVFGARIFDWYGLFERNIFAGQCEHGTYHLFPDYGVTEYIPVGVNEQGEALFELVGTGFINRVMPLIRYRTGDLVTAPSDHDCPCGRAFPSVKTLLGRANDMIIMPDGRKIGMLEFAFDVAGIACGQIIQETLDKLTVLVVPGPGYSAEVKTKILAQLQERIDPAMTIEYRCVEDIPRTKNGKFRVMVSRLQERSESTK